jgi:polyphosphate kinase 2
LERLSRDPEALLGCTRTQEGTMKRKKYNKKLSKLEAELAKLQGWIKNQGLRVVVIFEGRDAAGKGGTIKTITRRLNPRVVRTVALPVPSDRQKSELYLQRYIPHLPAAGEMVLFDRSWYNRLGVERVMGYCTDEQYETFLALCPPFEEVLTNDGITLIKYWLNVDDDEQERRFQNRNTDSRKRWKLSPTDLTARSHWVDYSKARDVVFEQTSTDWAPWHLADLNDKKSGRLNVISHLLDQVPYEDLTPAPLDLPDRQPPKGYKAPDWGSLEIPSVYE